MWDTGLIPGLGRSPGGGHGNPLHCSCLENPMNRGAWRATVQMASKCQIQLKWLSMHAHRRSSLSVNIWDYLTTKIMASGPITSWKIDEETVETVSDFLFLGSQITAEGDCSHEIKRCLLIGIKVMTNLDSILQSRDITLPTNACLVKIWFFQ